ncbi:hypothetical protein [Fictibacillus sp. BK138]|uniref:hypothetical protein n=1 Tax=Fictibacillus sp. BK138 TaxID=2512121 RepID=UPI0013EE541D|nr:hypothetical protein [Fictibacillus sp. BK138]
MAQSGRRLTARPAESEHPGAEINYFQEQQSSRKQPFYKTANNNVNKRKSKLKMKSLAD